MCEDLRHILDVIEFYPAIKLQIKKLVTLRTGVF